VNASYVRNQSSFTSNVFDSGTGQFYSRPTYDPASSTPYTRYSNAGSFEANTSAGSVLLQGGGMAGTYAVANNGTIYGRSSSISGTTVSAWDATTGALLNTASIPGIGGVNFTSTFNWGGFSGLNWMQDETGTYVFGRLADSSGWQLNKMNANLTVALTKTFVGTASYGYGFMLNGTLFLGNSYASPQISTAFNFGTGLTSVVDFELSSGFGYYSNTSYDMLTDTLYVQTDNRLFKVANAAEVFGVAEASPTPEPASMALLAMGGGLLAFGRKRLSRRRHSADVNV
jgi:autoaggregation protein RapA/B/C